MLVIEQKYLYMTEAAYQACQLSFNRQLQNQKICIWEQHLQRGTKP